MKNEKRTAKRYEQETTIRWDAQERIAHIYSANPSVIRKLDKLVEKYPQTYACVWEDDKWVAKKYRVPARWIRFGGPRIPKATEDERPTLNPDEITADNTSNASEDGWQ